MFGLNNIFTRMPEIIAAVALGSNSFHLIVARVEDGQLRTIDLLQKRKGHRGQVFKCDKPL